MKQIGESQKGKLPPWVSNSSAIRLYAATLSKSRQVYTDALARSQQVRVAACAEAQRVYNLTTARSQQYNDAADRDAWLLHEATYLSAWRVFADALDAECERGQVAVPPAARGKAKNKGVR